MRKDLFKRRVEKLEIALVLLINCLRARKCLADGTSIIPPLPTTTLDAIEKMVLSNEIQD